MEDWSNCRARTWGRACERAGLESARARTTCAIRSRASGSAYGLASVAPHARSSTPYRRREFR